MTTHNGQRVLVTAGAGGIGRAIAMAFASAGARVHACDIDASALSELHAQMPSISTSPSRDGGAALADSSKPWMSVIAPIRFSGRKRPPDQQLVG